MTDTISTILIIGAAGGIGEALARHFHTLAKKIIVTGREQDESRLSRLAEDLPGLEYRVWDLTHLDKLEIQVQNIINDFLTLDTVFINAGIQTYYDIFREPCKSDAVIRELTTNLTAPVLVAQAFASHLLARAQSSPETKTTLFLTSSSLAYFPVPFFPTYCAAKAGIAAFTKVLRMQMEATGCKNMNVVEVVPPYVDTPLDAAHREKIDELQGGSEKAVQPMRLEEYVTQFFKELERTTETGSFRNEIGVGFGARGAEIWHEGYERLCGASGLDS
ncbi:hypothetical protein NX059_011737 [Plenodomus lindquistii]|nr:hypothetical protein NX059_011737 [Plenodomus lindquistii]